MRKKKTPKIDKIFKGGVIETVKESVTGFANKLNVLKLFKSSDAPESDDASYRGRSPEKHNRNTTRLPTPPSPKKWEHHSRPPNDSSAINSLKMPKSEILGKSSNETLRLEIQKKNSGEKKTLLTKSPDGMNRSIPLKQLQQSAIKLKESVDGKKKSKEQLRREKMMQCVKNLQLLKSFDQSEELESACRAAEKDLRNFEKFYKETTDFLRGSFRHLAETCHSQKQAVIQELHELGETIDREKTIQEEQGRQLDEMIAKMTPMALENKKADEEGKEGFSSMWLLLLCLLVMAGAYYWKTS